jgi:hypothetical protein
MLKYRHICREVYREQSLYNYQESIRFLTEDKENGTFKTSEHAEDVALRHNNQNNRLRK